MHFSVRIATSGRRHGLRVPASTQPINLGVHWVSPIASGTGLGDGFDFQEYRVFFEES